MRETYRTSTTIHLFPRSGHICRSTPAQILDPRRTVRVRLHSFERWQVRNSPSAFWVGKLLTVRTGHHECATEGLKLCEWMDRYDRIPNSNSPASHSLYWRIQELSLWL